MTDIKILIHDEVQLVGNDSVPMKVCGGCGEEKVVSLFYTSRKNSDGFRGKCKECFRIQSRENRRRNPELYNKTQREWAAKNKERAKAICKKSRHREGSKYKETLLRWREKNPDFDRMKDLRRGAKKYGLEFRLTRKDVAEFLRQDSCVYCGAPCSVELDHFIPLVMGGPSERGNIVPCCRSCNSRKWAKEPTKWVTELFGKRALERVILYLEEQRNG